MPLGPISRWLSVSYFVVLKNEFAGSEPDPVRCSGVLRSSPRHEPETNCRCTSGGCVEMSATCHRDLVAQRGVTVDCQFAVRPDSLP